jgi:DNA ligase 1
MEKEISMQSAADVIAALEGTNGRLDKEKILQTAWQLGITEFFEGALMACDSLRTFGVKKVPLIDGEDDPNFVSTFTWDRFKSIAAKLESRELTGNAARDVLRAAADSASVRDWNGFYRRVLQKDLKCGVSEVTINKILEKAGGDAKKYVIPVFSCQLAKNGDDHPKKMTGVKLIDPKLDGVRIITILDKNKNTVTQYSRDGRLNENFPQIIAVFAQLLPVINQSMVFDGEVVSRSFQALMKQLNRKEDVDTKDAKLALFDCLPLEDFIAGECTLTQVQRHEALVQFIPLLEKISNGAVYVIPKLAVNLDTPEGQKTFTEFNREMVESGYEGIMVKDPAATYKTKRADSWLKLKPFITVDLEVVDFENGKPESRFSHTLGGLVCRGYDQGRLVEVTVGSGFSEELRDEIWNNRESVRGRIVEIKGDVITKSQDGDAWSLRFPVFMQFRGWQPGEKI